MHQIRFSHVKWNETLPGRYAHDPVFVMTTPRKGEVVILDGRSYTVSEVCHQFDNHTDPSISVYLNDEDAD